MKLSLTKPLAVFDLEATGLNVSTDRIVEIAILRLDPDGKRTSYSRRINPEIHISEEAQAVHGISNEEVKDCPKFHEIISEVEEFIRDCDLAGFNSNKFDLPMLAEEMLRANSNFDLGAVKHVDVQNIFHKKEQRTLVAAYSFYCNKDLDNAHNAFADAEATLEVLEAQLERYDDLEGNVDFLATFSRYGDVDRVDFVGRLAYNDQGEVIYNFGKHKGKTIADVARLEPGYYGWMMDADFPLYTKQRLKAEMEKVKARMVEEKNRKKEENQAHFQNKLDELKNKFKG